MISSLMTNSYQNKADDRAPWTWALAPRQARTLPASAAPRWLRVDSGCVWVTEQRHDAPAEDLWLNAGESLALPVGTAWIVEAWPQARLSLLQAAPVFSRAAPWGPAWGGLAALLRWPMRPWRALV